MNKFKIYEAIKSATHINITSENLKQLNKLPKDNPAYQKYVKPIKQRDKFNKIQIIKKWFLDNAISIIALIISIIALFKP